jgi:hypothetical protein
MMWRWLMVHDVEVADGGGGRDGGGATQLLTQEWVPIWQLLLLLTALQMDTHAKEIM